MSTYTSEPGTRLAGRYRLVDQVSEGAGWTYWKATDETLARPVTVLTFAAGFPRVAEAVTAARAASRLGDPRFSQVFDVEDGEELPYVVLEWVVGDSLLDMLAEGPLDPPHAAGLMAEAARAIAAAHGTGLAHQRLEPACLHWTPGGGVKIAGLGIDAALAGPDLTAGQDGEDPELTDTRDLARLLYAALTGYWPGGRQAAGTGAALPAAPESDGAPCTPRQVSAGVPATIDDVTCRALFQQPNRHGPPLSTAAMLADALAQAAPPEPVRPAAITAPADLGYLPAGTGGPYQPPGPAARAGADGGRTPPARRLTAVRAAASVVVVLVLAAVGMLIWSASRSPRHTAAPPPARPRPSAPAVVAASVLKPVRATSFDPLGGGGGEDPGQTGNAIDGNPATDWHTSYYLGSPVFGNLKKGTGLLLDMGRPVRLSQLTVLFGAKCCTSVQVEIGNSGSPTAAALGSFTVVATSTTAAGSTTFTPSRQVTGRYVLIWITSLPPLAGSPGKYEAMIYNVVARGYAAGRPG